MRPAELSAVVRCIGGGVFLPGAAQMMTLSADRKTCRIWDASTGDDISVLAGHTGKVLGAAAFLPPSSQPSLDAPARRLRLLTVSEDGTARLWEAASGEVLQVLRGHRKDVTGGAFFPDGERILTVSLDCTARAASGEEVQMLEGHSAALTSGTVFCNGQRLKVVHACPGIFYMRIACFSRMSCTVYAGVQDVSRLHRAL
ncbi:unnamed protein product [Polarella glacialis]|uniref:Uncharacterized protein n=1 Tax=Polarella glacialis TaxID=89957 RepID=A0A813IUN4_POLGL|nr:unnamed protein product [Polarella glacialis]